MKKTANSTDPVRRALDRFFYVMFAPVLKAARPRRKKPTIRDLERRYIKICDGFTSREMGKALKRLLGMVQGGEISASTMAVMLDTVKETIHAPLDDLVELDRIRDLAYEIGKDGVKKPHGVVNSTELVDQRALEWARKDNKYWIGNHFEDIGDRLREKLPEYIQQGMGSVEAGEQLEQLFGAEYGRNKSYWRGFAASAINRSRTFGEISGYEEAGVATYEILAVMDERTSPVCKFMNGKVFKVKTAANVRDDIINSPPEMVKTNHPWLSFKDVQNMTDEQLQAAGFVMPPFHFHCRTTTVMRDFEPPPPKELSFEEQVAMLEVDDEVYEFGVTDKEFTAVQEYTGSMSYLLNEALRNDTGIEQYADTIRNLDSALSKIPRFQGTLYRHLDFTGREEDYKTFVEQHKVGRNIIYQQYISTSVDPDLYDNKNSKLPVKITILNSHNGREITKLKGIRQDEKEVLYERVSAFHVIDARIVNNRQEIILVERGNDDSEKKV